jgi:hypothetical protein
MARSPTAWLRDRWSATRQWCSQGHLAARGFREGAHPFFWFATTAFVPAAVVAITVESRGPGYALNSVAIYRLEVGFACLLSIYMLVILLWLAYRGESFGNVQLPGGMGAELKNPDPDVTEAADDFLEFKKKTEQTLAKHEESIALLNEIEEELPQPNERG